MNKVLSSLAISKKEKKENKFTNSFMSSYISSLKTIKHDMTNNYTSDVYRRLSYLDDSAEFKQAINNQINMNVQRGGCKGVDWSSIKIDFNRISPVVKYLYSTLYK